MKSPLLSVCILYVLRWASLYSLYIIILHTRNHDGLLNISYHKSGVAYSSIRACIANMTLLTVWTLSFKLHVPLEAEQNRVGSVSPALWNQYHVHNVLLTPSPFPPLIYVIIMILDILLPGTIFRFFMYTPFLHYMYRSTFIKHTPFMQNFSHRYGTVHVC